MNNNEEIMLYIAKMYKEIKQEVAKKCAGGLWGECGA